MSHSQMSGSKISSARQLFFLSNWGSSFFKYSYDFVLLSTRLCRLACRLTISYCASNRPIPLNVIPGILRPFVCLFDCVPSFILTTAACAANTAASRLSFAARNHSKTPHNVFSLAPERSSKTDVCLLQRGPRTASAVYKRPRDIAANPRIRQI